MTPLSCVASALLLTLVASQPVEAGSKASALAKVVSRASRDIARAGLAVEIPSFRGSEIRRYQRALKTEADVIRASPTHDPSDSAILDALNARFFGPSGFIGLSDASAPEGSSVATVLRTRRGTCVGLAIVYLALAQRLGLDAHGVATPDHLFVRVKVGGQARNVELMEAGTAIDDDTYRRRHRIDEASIAAGVFMRELTNAEVISHLLSNQTVALGKQGNLGEALASYDAALQLHPQLVAAWYNRGLDLMTAGRLREALTSFDRAIELFPSDAQAYNNRGLARFKLSDIEGARSDWMRALELQPGMREAEENLRKLTGSR